jgi:hypothetical protein
MSAVHLLLVNAALARITVLKLADPAWSILSMSMTACCREIYSLAGQKESDLLSWKMLAAFEHFYSSDQ